MKYQVVYKTKNLLLEKSIGNPQARMKYQVVYKTKNLLLEKSISKPRLEKMKYQVAYTVKQNICIYTLLAIDYFK